MAINKKTALESVIGTMALEGLVLPEDGVSDLQAIIDDKRSADDSVADIIAKYQAIAQTKTKQAANG